VVSRASTLRPRALYSSTATQIGLLPNENIPDLISEILPNSKSGHSSRFFQRWLLHPPPYALADCFQSLCSALVGKGENSFANALPEMYPVPLGKIISLLMARQCNTAVFRDILQCMEGTLEMLHPDNADLFSKLNEPMTQLTSYESGLPVHVSDLFLRASNVRESVADIILGHDDIDSDKCNEDLRAENRSIPSAFFARNEMEFRGCVLPASDINASPDRVEVAKAYNEVNEAAKELCDIVNEDFPLGSEVENKRCIILSYFILCYVMLCYVMLCYVL